MGRFVRNGSTSNRKGFCRFEPTMNTHIPSDEILAHSYDTYPPLPYVCITGLACAHCHKFFKQESTDDINADTETTNKKLICSRCRRVWYCSAECQVPHWKRSHKRECKSFAASSSKSFEEMTLSICSQSPKWILPSGQLSYVRSISLTSLALFNIYHSLAEWSSCDACWRTRLDELCLKMKSVLFVCKCIVWSAIEQKHKLKTVKELPTTKSPTLNLID